MRVLVTGGAGYVGSRVTGHLLEAGYEVTVLDVLMYGGEGLLPFVDHPRFRLVANDLRDPSAVKEALAGVRAVLHLAAVVGEPACQVDPAATIPINTEATISLVRTCGAAQVERFIFVSTCSNYGVSDPNQLVDETSPLQPLSLYAESKVRAEKGVLANSSNGMAICVLRFGTVCGLSPRMRFNLLVNEMARKAALDMPILVYGPKAWRPFLHIRDAARVLEECLQVPAEALRGKVFNVVSENYQKIQLADLVRRHFPDARIEIQDQASDSRDYRVRAERIREELGFVPQRTVEQAFLEVAGAVRRRIFPEPDRPLYEAAPDQRVLKNPIDWEKRS